MAMSKAMRAFNKMASGFAVATLIASPLLNFQISANAQSTQTPDESVIVSSFQAILDRILRRDEETQSGAGSRGDEICIIETDNGEIDGEAAPIWHTQPAFIWQNSSDAVVGQVVLFDTESQSALWSYTPTREETHVIYEGEPLAPERDYVWYAYDANDLGRQIGASNMFELMTERDRSSVGRHLRHSYAANVSEAEYTDVLEDKSSLETSVLATAEAFSVAGLRGDTIYTLFLADLSPDKQDKVQLEITNFFCERATVKG